MIPKPVHAIGRDDLQALIDGRAAEDKTVEYKREMPGGADSQMVPFLAAVSSFANTSGGDLLLGVEAADGIPTALPGIEIPNPDGERLRLEQALAGGLEPRLPPVDMHFVEVGDGRHVPIVRVPRRSWVAPHRVRKNDKFYGRNSAGRYPLDVGELRAAFTLSETVAERVRSFRADRLAKVYGGETPVAVRDGGRMVLHVLPLSAFTNQEALDLSNYYQHRLHLPPMGSSGWDHLINLDGFVTYTSGREHGSRAYTQLFRTGAVEAVSQVPANDGAMFIPSTGYEEETACFLATYAKAAYGLGVEPPCYVFLSFLGVRGCRFGVGRGWMLAHEPPPLREDTLLLPEVVLEDRDFEPHRVLRPVFDMVWNAFGFERSLNYDDDGNWAPR